MSSSGANGSIQRWSFARRSRELHCCVARGFEHGGEFPSPYQRQQALRGPERYGGSAGARTFQADFAEMKIRRSEIGVGRIVFVDCADLRIAKQHAAAAVGLQAVLVRINDDGIGAANQVEAGARFHGEIGCEREIAAVRGIYVQAKTVAIAQAQNFGQRIHGAGSRCAFCRDYAAYIAGC